jgi:hypothetical protein
MRASDAGRRPGPAAAPRVALGVVIAVATWAAAAEEPVAPPLPAASAAWSVRLPKEEKVAFQGAVSFDGAGTGTNSMLYPVPGIVGLFAAVMTHAVIVNSVRGSQKTKLQEEADKVLEPLRGVLADYGNRALVQSALERTRAGVPIGVVEPTVTGSAGWLVDTTPVFVVTQDRRALILENAVAVYPPNAPAPAYSNLVRVVSSAEPDSDAAERWGADQGARLKALSAELLARSIDIVIEAATAAAAPSTAPERTFRYVEGGKDRMERAQLVTPGCERVVVRTLRGWLMSIPLRAGSNAGDPSCAVAK